MVWVLYALLTAFFESLKDVFSKRSLKNVNEYIVALSFRWFALPIILPVLLYVGIPPLKEGFFFILLLSGILNTFTSILFMKSLKHADLSVAIPMLAFSPLFLLITSPLINGEFPTTYGLFGVLFIVAGSYTLNIKERHKGFFEPFKALIRKKGPRYMLIVAFLWSISANIDKIGVLKSSPVMWVFSLYFFLALSLLPITYFKAKEYFTQIPKHWKGLSLIGASGGIRLILQMMAIQIALVPYVISIKRTSAVMSVLFGYFIFKEQGLSERLFGVVLMILGVLFITLF